MRQKPQGSGASRKVETESAEDSRGGEVEAPPGAVRSARTSAVAIDARSTAPTAVAGPAQGWLPSLSKQEGRLGPVGMVTVSSVSALRYHQRHRSGSVQLDVDRLGSRSAVDEAAVVENGAAIVAELERDGGLRAFAGRIVDADDRLEGEGSLR